MARSHPGPRTCLQPLVMDLADKKVPVKKIVSLRGIVPVPSSWSGAIRRTAPSSN